MAYILIGSVVGLISWGVYGYVKPENNGFMPKELHKMRIKLDKEIISPKDQKITSSTKAEFNPNKIKEEDDI